MIATQLSAGRLIRLRPGVFVDAAVWPSDPVEQHILRARAETAVHPAAVISHSSAALIWGLPCPSPQGWSAEPVTVTLPRGDRHRTRFGRVVHRLGPLPPSHQARDASGYPVTSLARTAIDVAKDRSLPEALVVLDGAARRACSTFVAQPRRADFSNQRFQAAAREELLEAAAVLRVARLRQVIDLVDPARESAVESLSAGHIHLAGLPRPQYQPAIRTPWGKLYPDCLWPEHRLIGECDGKVKYRDPAESIREKEREQLLRDLDFRFVRWLAKEIMYQPALVIDRIRRALAA